MRPAAAYFHPSNLLTYLSVLAGLAAIALAGRLGSWPVAGGLLAFCALADTLDGRFARLFPRDRLRREFGIQIDSLSDSLNFGVVPVVCLFLLLSLEDQVQALWWWGAAFIYLLCAMTRLGAFNLKGAESPDFIGIPTTVAGLFWSSVFLLNPSVEATALLLVLTGVAMVSPIRIHRPRGRGLFLFGMWAVGLIVLHGALAKW